MIEKQSPTRQFFAKLRLDITVPDVPMFDKMRQDLEQLKAFQLKPILESMPPIVPPGWPHYKIKVLRVRDLSTETAVTFLRKKTTGHLHPAWRKLILATGEINSLRQKERAQVALIRKLKREKVALQKLLYKAKNRQKGLKYISPQRSEKDFRNANSFMVPD